MLRPATFADLPEILRIQALCYHDIEPEQPAAYINKLEQAPDCAFVIEGQNQTLSAYLFALPIRIDEPPCLDASDLVVPRDANCLYLHDLAIAPAGRGQGLSRPLLNAFFQRAKQRGLSQSSLIAIQNSTPFWHKQGFTHTPLSTSAAIQAKLQSYGQAHYLIRR